MFIEFDLENTSFKQLVTGAISTLFAFSSLNLPVNAVTKSELGSLSYEQVKGTGLANRCPSVSDGAASTIQLSSGKKYKITDLCLEPTNWQVGHSLELFFWAKLQIG
jgi:hypothetical protein